MQNPASSHGALYQDEEETQATFHETISKLNVIGFYALILIVDGLGVPLHDESRVEHAFVTVSSKASVKRAATPP